MNLFFSLDPTKRKMLLVVFQAVTMSNSTLTVIMLLKLVAISGQMPVTLRWRLALSLVILTVSVRQTTAF